MGIDQKLYRGGILVFKGFGSVGYGHFLALVFDKGYVYFSFTELCTVFLHISFAWPKEEELGICLEFLSVWHPGSPADIDSIHRLTVQCMQCDPNMGMIVHVVIVSTQHFPMHTVLSGIKASVHQELYVCFLKAMHVEELWCLFPFQEEFYFIYCCNWKEKIWAKKDGCTGKV